MKHQELKELVEHINKIKNQIDGLKYYLFNIKKKDKNVEFIQSIVSDMDHLVFVKMFNVEKSIKDDIKNLEHEEQLVKMIKKYHGDTEKIERVAKFKNIKTAIINESIKTATSKGLIKDGSKKV